MRSRADLLDQSLAEVERRNEQLAEPPRPAEAGQEVEEIGDVGRDVRVCREEAEVLVGPGRRGVVVAGADVCVPAQLSIFPADDERGLRMDLQVGEPVDDVDAGLLERAGPADVPALVEARLQLDEANRLLSHLRGLDQRGNERRVTARPVDGRLQCQAVGIGRGRADEGLEARPERVVGLVHEDVASRDLGEELVR